MGQRSGGARGDTPTRATPADDDCRVAGIPRPAVQGLRRGAGPDRSDMMKEL